MAMLISLSHRDEREITVLPPNPIWAFGVNRKTHYALGWTRWAGWARSIVLEMVGDLTLNVCSYRPVEVILCALH